MEYEDGGFGEELDGAGGEGDVEGDVDVVDVDVVDVDGVDVDGVDVDGVDVGDDDVDGELVLAAGGGR